MGLTLSELIHAHAVAANQTVYKGPDGYSSESDFGIADHHACLYQVTRNNCHLKLMVDDFQIQPVLCNLAADDLHLFLPFELLLSDSRVKAIMVNIFGGIMKCDVIAEGIVAAAKTTGLSIPLIVRLEGTNVELGKKILDESGLAIIPASDMADAARKAVAAASEGGAK